MIRKESLPLYFSVAIILVSCIFCYLCIHPGHNWGGDFALYIHEAKALKEGSLGELYLQNKFSMDHSEKLIGPYLYPLGFPVLLSGIYALFGMNILVMKIFCMLFFIASLLVIYLFFKDKFRKNYLVILLISLIGLHPAFCTFTDNVLSDLPFFFFIWMSFLLMEKNKNIFPFVLLILFAVNTRSPGILILPALFIWQILYQKANFKNWKSWLPYLVVIAVAILHKFLLPSFSQNHLNILNDNFNLSSVYTELQYQMDLLTIYTWPTGFSSSSHFVLLKWILLLFVITGIIVSGKKYFHLLAFLVLNVSLLALWPNNQGTRLLFPVIPVYLFYLLTGIDFVLAGAGKYVLIAASAWIAWINFNSIIHFSRTETDNVFATSSEQIFNYVIEKSEKEDLFVFFKPRVFRLMTGRNAFYHKQPDQIIRTDADFIILQKHENVPVPGFRTVFTNEEFIIQKRISL